MRLSNLLERGVANAGLGDGNVDDVLIDLARGAVKYVLATFVDVPSGDLFLIPYDAFDTALSTDALAFASGFDPNLLGRAPRLPRAVLMDPPQAGPSTEAQAHAFWREQGYLQQWGENGGAESVLPSTNGNLVAGATITNTATVTSP